MTDAKHKAKSWDDLKKWFEGLKKTEPDLKEFADMALTRMKEILEARQGAVGIQVAIAIDEAVRLREKESK